MKVSGMPRMYHAGFLPSAVSRPLRLARAALVLARMGIEHLNDEGLGDDHRRGLLRQAISMVGSFNADEAAIHVRRLLAYKLLSEDADTITFRRDGIVWTAFTGDRYVSWSLFNAGSFEGEEMASLLQWLAVHHPWSKERNTIVDVGANIGTTSIPLAKLTGRKVLAIEPVPRNYDLLRKNVGQNGLDDLVTCIQAAVTTDRGVVRMSFDPYNSGGSEITRQSYSPEDADHVLEVQGRPLAEILVKHKIAPTQIGLVWSDTQGFERSVIESGRDLWASGIPLYVEFWPEGLQAHGGVDLFIESAIQHFCSCVLSEDLTRFGADAERHSVDVLRGLVRTLRDGSTDILLIPNAVGY